MSLFVDTGAWVAMYAPQDGHHRMASRVARDRFKPGLVLTSEAVLGEALTVLRVRFGHAVAMRFQERLDADPSAFEAVYTDPALRSEAVAIFGKAADQRFSYVDCVSFAIMRRRGIREAFTFDDDFAKFGFTVVPGTG